MLNDKQQYCFEQAIKGKNIFLTGGAGTGKTMLLQQIISNFKINNKKIGITSSTGVSATHINGTTLHSFLCLGLGKDNVYKIFNNIKKKYKSQYYKLLKLEVLIIDEISMINKNLFNKISRLLQLIKRNTKSFGGIQILFSGDFCQLKPVKSNAFCFESYDWKLLNIEIIKLTYSFRQKEDVDFTNILNNLRFGNMTNKIYNILFEHCKKTKNLKFDNTEIKPTKLYSNNIDVDSINLLEHNKLKDNKTKLFKTNYTKNHYIKKYIKDNHIRNEIELSINDQVIITKNIDIEQHIINGTRGIIKDIYEYGVLIQLKDNKEILIEKYNEPFDEDDNNIKTSDYLNYIPLKLGYAITIHSSQGMTIDFLQVDLGPTIFEYGQLYVALSRGKSLDKIIIINISKKSCKCHEKVLKFYKIYTKKMKNDSAKKIQIFVKKLIKSKYN